MNRLIVIDDEPQVCELVADIAAGRGYDTAVATDAGAFWATYDAFKPTVIVLDLQMPGTDGVEMLRALSEHSCRAGIIVISGQDPRVLMATKRRGADLGLSMLGALSKPLALESFEGLIDAAKVEDRTITEGDLREAIDQGQLAVHYQPKVALTAPTVWTVEGAEALVRWAHPRLGRIMPDAFIPLAESSGLIGPLTDYVLAAALDQASLWREAGLSLSMAVNLAPQLLGDLALPDRIARVLADKRVPASVLTLEITESGAMADASLTMDILARFRLKGIGLSIDDFGTGYSSLVQLYRMPFSELKIDQSFVANMINDTEAETIVRMMIDLAHNLGLTLCAEGVESQDALDLLEALGCEKAQGYHIGKPGPASDLTQMLQESRQESRGQSA